MWAVVRSVSPPPITPSSSTITETCFCARQYAVVSPAMPAPTMHTSAEASAERGWRRRLAVSAHGERLCAGASMKEKTVHGGSPYNAALDGAAKKCHQNFGCQPFSRKKRLSTPSSPQNPYFSFSPRVYETFLPCCPCVRPLCGSPYARCMQGILDGFRVQNPRRSTYSLQYRRDFHQISCSRRHIPSPHH